MNNTSLHFQSLLSGAISLLVTIFGPSITYATLSHIREISLDSSGKVIGIEGVDEEIISKLLAEFSILSPEVTQTHIAPIFAAYALPAASPQAQASSLSVPNNIKTNSLVSPA